MAVIGIDGYHGGWVAARVEGSSVSWITRPTPAVVDLLEPGLVIAIDMPIGLADRGWRECDEQAKQALGRARSRVFMTPPRAVLALGLAAPNEQVQELSRELTGQGTSRQAMGLAERILALDAALRSVRDSSVIEVHPELSFAEMTGSPLTSKKTAAGVGQRVDALLKWRPDVVTALAQVPDSVPIDDALDALACAWTAERWREGRSRRIPAGAAQAPFIAV